MMTILSHGAGQADAVRVFITAQGLGLMCRIPRVLTL